MRHAVCDVRYVIRWPGRTVDRETGAQPLFTQHTDPVTGCRYRRDTITGHTEWVNSIRWAEDAEASTVAPTGAAAGAPVNTDTSQQV